tara:strand:+ start:3435 stop:4226 length:792 start_codon:yes stop_codon:yes gene_type:complete
MANDHYYFNSFRVTLSFIMAVGIIFIRLYYYVFHGCRHFIETLLLVQRLPYLILFPIGWFFIRSISFITRWHSLLIFYVRCWCRLYFFLNGIRIHSTDLRLSVNSHTTLLFNSTELLSYAALFCILPYKKLLLLPNSFFDGFFFKKGLHLLGFYPSETHYDIHSYEKNSFHLDPYAKQGFLFVEGVNIEKQAYDAIPYSFMIAVKHKLTTYLIQANSTKESLFTTFWTPKKIRFKTKHVIIPGKRKALTLFQYRHFLKSWDKA